MCPNTDNMGRTRYKDSRRTSQPDRSLVLAASPCPFGGVWDMTISASEGMSSQNPEAFSGKYLKAQFRWFGE
jgi:hypothetical protein